MTARLLVLLGVLGPLWTAGLWQISPWLALVPPFCVHALLLIGTLVPNCPLFSKVTHRLPLAENQIVLTIDDGPDNDTPEILALLKQHHAQAVFFLVGHKAAAHPDLVQAILMAGHHIANHTWSHASGSYWAFIKPFAGRQIDRCTAALESAGAPAPIWFRAPAELANPFVHLAAKKRGLHILGWSVRALDGVRPSRARAVRRIRAGLKPGAILLLHQGRPAIPGQQNSSTECLADVLAAISASSFFCVPPPIPEPIQRQDNRQR